MKFERNLFFRGHREIVLFLWTGVGFREQGWGSGGRARAGGGVVVKVDGRVFSTVFTNRQTNGDGQAGSGWGRRGRGGVLCHVWIKTSRPTPNIKKKQKKMSNFHGQFCFFLQNTQSSIRKQQQHKQKVTRGRREGRETGFVGESPSCMVWLIFFFVFDRGVRGGRKERQ